MYDVVVVGGGPAGCYTASLLGDGGLDVHVLEEHSVIGEPVDCSGVIGAEAFSAMNLPQSLVLAKISDLTLVSPSELEIKFSPNSDVAYVVNRGAFDRVIADRTLESGVQIHLGCQVVDLRVLKDCVELDVKGDFESSFAFRNGDESQEFEKKVNERIPKSDSRKMVRARLAIISGGPRYRLQQKLGMGEPPEFLRTAQTELEVRCIRGTKVLMGSQVAPGSFAWIVPFQREGKEFARVGVSAKRNAVPFLESLVHRLYSQGHLGSRSASIRSWLIPINPLRKTFSDRVLAVGDAAGQTKPTTGGGIYYGVLAAKAAANAVCETFKKGEFSARALHRYQREWRKRFGKEIRAGRLFRRLVERLTDEEIDSLFRIVQSDGILAEVTRKARFDWHNDIIYFTLRHPELGKIVFRGLFR